MKIGILTHQYVNNYGAFLQAYALRELITKMFPNDEVQIINYINVRHFIINICGWFRFRESSENLRGWLQKIRMPYIFAKERKKYMHCSRRCFTAKQINRLNFDCIVIGSDEVWNYEDKKSRAKIKFGKGLACKNLIAYAPSVGKTNIQNGIPEYVRKGISEFKAVSVRDELTGRLVKKIVAREVPVVLDPTFFGKFHEARLRAKRTPYILFYYCEKLPRDIYNQIFTYAAEHGLSVYGAGDCDKNYEDATINLTPFEWVEMFRNAEFVFTGTFHGAVFSILNRKQFKVYLTKESRIQKVSELLNTLGIEGRMIESDFIFNLKNAADMIDYKKVYEIIDKKLTESCEFLKGAIQ